MLWDKDFAIMSWHIHNYVGKKCKLNNLFFNIFEYSFILCTAYSAMCNSYIMQIWSHYKRLSNTKLLTLRLTARQGSCEPLVTIFFVKWPIYTLVLCMFLFQYISHSIYCWLFTLNSWTIPTLAYVSLKLKPIHIFPRVHITVFLCLETLDSTSVLCLGTILSSMITKRKYKNVKYIVLNITQRGNL